MRCNPMWEGVVACGLAATVGACGPTARASDHRNLRIGTQAAVYFGTNTPVDHSTAYAPGQLGLGIDLPVDSVVLDYQGHAGQSVMAAALGGTNAEAHAFVQNPQATWDGVFHIADMSNPKPAFEALVAHRAGGVGLVWPLVECFDVNGSGCPPLPPRSSVDLSCSLFFGPNTVCAGAVTSNGSVITSTVQSVRVYDRGGCAKKVGNPGRDFAQDLWCSFKDSVAGSGEWNVLGLTLDFGMVAKASRHANQWATVITHPDASATTATGGGFVGYADYSVDFYSGNFGEVWAGDRRFYLVYGYQFGLTDGILSIGDFTDRYHYMSSGTFHPLVIDKLDASLKTDAITEFHKAAAVAQQAPIPSIFRQPVPCDPAEDAYAQCGLSVDALRAGLGMAADQGLITDNERKDLLAGAVLKKSNWSCAADRLPYYDAHACIGYLNGGPQPVCRLQLRAKRVNVYPDAVELVWWNGDERPTDSAAFAVEKALEATGADTSQLCTPQQPDYVGHSYYQEAFVYDGEL